MIPYNLGHEKPHATIDRPGKLYEINEEGYNQMKGNGNFKLKYGKHKKNKTK